VRNGLNIASVSEYVHVILATPKEARLLFSLTATRLSEDLIEVRTLPVWIGTIRVVRDFTIRIDRAGRGGEWKSTDFVTASAIGGCVATTFVQGASARGVTLDQLQLQMRLAMTPDSVELAYDYQPQCEASDEMLISLARYVCCLSSIHRTLVEPNQIRVTGSAAPLDSRELAALTRPLAANVRIGWRYGTHLRSTIADHEEIEMDQPKQYLGLDRAPSPTEYMFAALTADVLAALPSPPRSERLDDRRVIVSASVDMRGILNVSEDAPVAVQDIEVRAVDKCGDDIGVEALQSALRASPIARLICQPQEVSVIVNRDKRQLHRLLSNLETQKVLLAELKAAR
jgi:uncharacterized OsmC-like protein